MFRSRETEECFDQAKEIKQVERYLRVTDKEELNPDKLKEDLDSILNDPQTTPQILEERVNKFDRFTLSRCSVLWME